MINLAFAALAAAIGHPVYLECPLPSADGHPVVWKLALAEAQGFADITIGELQPMRTKATFYPDKVSFRVGVPGPIPIDVLDVVASQPGMKMEVSRVDLKVARYSLGDDSPPNFGQCKLVKAKPVAF